MEIKTSVPFFFASFNKEALLGGIFDAQYYNPLCFRKHPEAIVYAFAYQPYDVVA